RGSGSSPTASSRPTPPTASARRAPVARSLSSSSSGAMTVEIQLNDPQTLYRRWEASQWSPFSIDLTTDAQQWPALADDVRALLLFVLSSLMVAEERITTKFSGLVKIGRVSGREWM